MASPHDSRPDPTTLPEQSAGAVGHGVAAPTAGFQARAWALTLALALAAGLIGWACSEMMLVPEVGAGKKGGPVRVLPEVPATRNAIVTFGIFGAALGLGLGLAGGLLRRSVLWTILAAAIGLVLGGPIAAGVAWLILPIYYKQIMTSDLAYSLLVHGGAWTAIGAAAGLAFGLGRGGLRRILPTLVGAAAVALLATIIYEFAGMMLFPTAMTDRPLAKTTEIRLLAQLLVAAMVAAGALLFASQAADGSRRKNPEAPIENPRGE
ncbi:MAG: hypothetical protein ACLQGP_28565 [Isosphaeraceae bacterium]